jgi:hypothetical protein
MEWIIEIDGINEMASVTVRRWRPCAVPLSPFCQAIKAAELLQVATTATVWPLVVATRMVAAR